MAVDHKALLDMLTRPKLTATRHRLDTLSTRWRGAA
jgi:hypothetical protein